ncbi:apolipoprotein D-like [Homalodisca vitripennis]|uniref:apolipoprotein D-like n=1 Tax=Homalodisca vitripennis TaxID=197043 RepID=UPI001EEBB044|nr:apolipoprotein D-like [Homalodisca vitripennis]KAG8293236.1 hypothetical protein J6590_023396 [Homalodisca vitripennis]
MKSQLLLVLCLAIQAWGSCPKVSVVESLDLDKFMGTWYQYASHGEFFIKGWDRCVKSVYTLGDDKKTITMENTRIVNGIEKPVDSTWTAEASDPADGKLKIKVKVPVLGQISVPLNVLATDYDTYAVIHACKQLAFLKSNSVMILTRDQTPSEDTITKIDEAVEPVLEKNGFDKTKFTLTSQDDCDNPADFLQHWDKVAAVIKG